MANGLNIRLTGGKALAVLVLIVGFLVWKFTIERTTLATEAAEAIKFDLRGQYLSRAFVDFDPAELSDAEMQAAAEELMRLDDIAFTAMSARGRGDDVSVRVEIQVAGKDPPDGKSVRYYQMSHSLVTGWRVERETTALSYYLALF